MNSKWMVTEISQEKVRDLNIPELPRNSENQTTEASEEENNNLKNKQMHCGSQLKVKDWNTTEMPPKKVNEVNEAGASESYDFENEQNTIKNWQKVTIDSKKVEYEFKKYMDIYKADPELGHLMKQMTFQELFNEKFITENSRFTSMDDMLRRSDLGLTSPLEIEKVNQDKWNAFIANNTSCETWHQFGKLAMIDWMRTVIDLWAQVKEKRTKEKK